jgi:hypothetical protein
MEHHGVIFNILWEMVVSSDTSLKINAAALLKALVSFLYMNVRGLMGRFGRPIRDRFRDKIRFLLRDQRKSSLYKERCISLIKQELEGTTFFLARPWAAAPGR